MTIRNVREHLGEHHGKSASFDLAIGSELEKIRRTFESLEGQSDDGDAKKSYGAGKDAFAKLAVAFNEHAAYHKKMKEACAKSDGVDDLDKLQPSGVSAVYDPSKGIRPVIRAGQREIPGATDTMPQVDSAFEHLVKVDE